MVFTSVLLPFAFTVIWDVNLAVIIRNSWLYWYMYWYLLKAHQWHLWVLLVFSYCFHRLSAKQGTGSGTWIHSRLGRPHWSYCSSTWSQPRRGTETSASAPWPCVGSWWHRAIWHAEPQLSGKGVEKGQESFLLTTQPSGSVSPSLRGRTVYYKSKKPAC